MKGIYRRLGCLLLPSHESSSASMHQNAGGMIVLPISCSHSQSFSYNIPCLSTRTLLMCNMGCVFLYRWRLLLHRRASFVVWRQTGLVGLTAYPAFSRIWRSYSPQIRRCGFDTVYLLLLLFMDTSVTETISLCIICCLLHLLYSVSNQSLEVSWWRVWWTDCSICCFLAMSLPVTLCSMTILGSHTLHPLVCSDSAYIGIALNDNGFASARAFMYNMLFALSLYRFFPLCRCLRFPCHPATHSLVANPDTSRALAIAESWHNMFPISLRLPNSFGILARKCRQLCCCV